MKLTNEANPYRIRRLKMKRLLMLLIASLFLGTGFAQDKANDNKAKPLTFHGKVEAVTDKGLTVNGEKVEGWMGAMTMTYPVDKPDVLKNVKVGDQIIATVYSGDMTLHNVEVMPPEKSGKQKSK
jgi:Cu/Ag efflux protein CusF